jgi:hypothetical protein
MTELNSDPTNGLVNQIGVVSGQKYHNRFLTWLGRIN